LRIADCGLRREAAMSNPHSAIANPHSAIANPQLE